ncbi:MAG: hypothetical protein RR612_06295 [Oscillospiraceae bacterium]
MPNITVLLYGDKIPDKIFKSKKTTSKNVSLLQIARIKFSKSSLQKSTANNTDKSAIIVPAVKNENFACTILKNLSS